MAKKNGLADIESIINVAKKSLKPGGIFALEFGFSQAEYVENQLSKNFEVEIIRDQFLVRRFAFAIKK